MDSLLAKRADSQAVPTDIAEYVPKDFVDTALSRKTDKQITASSPGTAGNSHTLASARLLLPKTFGKAKGAFKVLVARCNMCIVRCTFDSGISYLLPRLRHDLRVHAATEPLDRATCNELLSILALIQTSGKELSSKQLSTASSYESNLC